MSVSKRKNLVIVTHYSIITKVTNSSPSSGEIIIINKNFDILFLFILIKL